MRAALRKLVQALPATFRDHAEAAAAAVVRDPAGWDHPQPAALEHLESIQRAVIEGVQLQLGYRGRDGKVTSRLVHPLGLVVKNDTWYLIAGTDAGQRTFRVSRVRSAESNGLAVERPEDFDLARRGAQSSRRWTANVPRSRSCSGQTPSGRTCCATSSATASSTATPTSKGRSR